MCYWTAWCALFSLQPFEYINSSKILMGQTENSAVVKGLTPRGATTECYVQLSLCCKRNKLSNFRTLFKLRRYLASWDERIISEEWDPATRTHVSMARSSQDFSTGALKGLMTGRQLSLGMVQSERLHAGTDP